ncbi:MAG TPA: hypoxanthine-guanine phosphoribosyltransferase [Gammaproteobacteria bacterium]|nr:hypoxanthine-guanine phosphoribosyltransferase [Gammaproteobacteria bacterium]
MRARGERRDPSTVRRAGRELVSPTAIESALDRLGDEVTVALGAARPVVVAVMHGGVFAATALARRLDFPYEFDYVHLSRYHDTLEGREVVWHVRPRLTLRNRHVLVVDDILDHGRTLEALTRELAALRVASLHTAVLVAKDLAAPHPRPAVDFIGVRVPDSYVFGCGMDYEGYWRGLPGLYTIDPE